MVLHLSCWSGWMQQVVAHKGTSASRERCVSRNSRGQGSRLESSQRDSVILMHLRRELLSRRMCWMANGMDQIQCWCRQEGTWMEIFNILIRIYDRHESKYHLFS
ncbi:mCG141165 [Mus musculus]|nr:mCG141165 [Mus musculus]